MCGFCSAVLIVDQRGHAETEEVRSLGLHYPQKQLKATLLKNKEVKGGDGGKRLGWGVKGWGWTAGEMHHEIWHDGISNISAAAIKRASGLYKHTPWKRFFTKMIV